MKHLLSIKQYDMNTKIYTNKKETNNGYSKRTYGQIQQDFMQRAQG